MAAMSGIVKLNITEKRGEWNGLRVSLPYLKFYPQIYRASKTYQ